MGVLDDLKKEAEAIEAEKARETTDHARALERARALIQPRMQALFKYFSELKQHLQVITREITAAYEIRGVGRVDGLVQGQYGVSTERPEQIDKFMFRCVCAKPGTFQVNQSDAGSVAAYRDYLRDNGLQAKVRDTGRATALFMVQPAVPVVVEFTADYERGAILLRLRNLSVIGVTRHTLTLEQVNDKFMDELAKAVLRQPNRVDEMLGNTISETGKIRIKKKVQAAMRQKELEEELARREAAAERTITKRFSRTFFGRKD